MSGTGSSEGSIERRQQQCIAGYDGRESVGLAAVHADIGGAKPVAQRNDPTAAGRNADAVEYD
jgi:hypothetical protein